MKGAVAYGVGWIGTSAVGFVIIKNVSGGKDYVEVLLGCVVVILSFLVSQVLGTSFPSTPPQKNQT